MKNLSEYWKLIIFHLSIYIIANYWIPADRYTFSYTDVIKEYKIIIYVNIIE